MPTGQGTAPEINSTTTPSGVVVAPDAFFSRTEGRIRTPFNDAAKAAAGGAFEPRRLPSSGVIGKLNVQLSATITITEGTGAVTTGPRWPHGIIEAYGLEADQRTDVFRSNGQDLHVLRGVRHPASLQSSTDLIPGGIGAGNALADGDNELLLSFEVPIAVDDSLLIGSLFAQSDSITIQQVLRQADITDLLVVSGDATIDSVSGTWETELESWTLPMTERSENGRPAELIVPDISVYHAVIGKQHNFTTTGEIPVSITRGAGQLDRLLIQVASSTDRGVTTDPYLGTSDPANGIEEVVIRYGAGNEPRVFRPAHFLADRNLKHYGQTLPYGYLCIDNLAENPPRDIINMQGVTDLEIVIVVGGSVSPSTDARVRVVAEMLLQGQGGG